MSAAVLTVFKQHLPLEDLREVLDAFDGETVVSAGEDVVSADYVRLVTSIPALRPPLAQLLGVEGPLDGLEANFDAAVIASAVEFVLEGLHLSKRLNKEAVGTRAQYRGR